jgi:STE24 endopeptidase
MREFIIAVCLSLSVLFSASAFCATPTEERALLMAATDKTAYTLPPAKMAKAIENDRAGLVIAAGESIEMILAVGLILWLGAAARMRDLALRVSSNRWAQCFVFVFQIALVLTVLDLPFTLYGRFLDLKYGTTVQSWGGFSGDQVKSFAIQYLLGSLLTMLLFRVIRKSPRHWWFWFWVPFTAITLFLTFVKPYTLDPLFDHFEPLSETAPALVAELEKVVARGQVDIPADRMFLMKASDKVTTLNAYVTGIGASKRIVVWDTSIQKGTPDEIAFIFGHEMGHYVLGHLVIGAAFSFTLLLIQFWAGYHAVQWLLRRFGKAWRIPAQNDWATLVVLALVIDVLSLVASPIQNTFHRSLEHNADVYGQEAVHGIVNDPQKTGRDVFQLLGEASLRDPNPSRLVEFWYYNHPSTNRRAAFALYYDPWKAGEAPKYFTR